MHKQSGRRSRLSPREANRYAGLHRLGFGLESLEQLLGLLEPSLKHTDLRESGRRRDAARALPRGCQLTNRLLELGLRCVDPAVGGEHIRATRPTEGEQRHVVVRAHELVQHRAPLLRALAVASTLAGEHERAANVREGLEVGGLAARSGSHRLVEPSETRSTSPSVTSASPSWASARSSRSGSRAASATSSADVACSAAVAASRAPSERASSSQPRSAPGATSRVRRSARASQPRDAASLSNASPYSRASQSATRAARASSPSRRKPAYARSRWTTAPRSSRSHQSARPSPSSASAESVESSAS